MFETIREHTIAVTSNIFETMFFIVLEIGEDETPLEDIMPPATMLRGEIEFEGKHTGRLTLDLPVELAQTMASNFLGLEEEKAPDYQADDMVRELCNMICGNLFSRVDQKTVWNLTIPRTRRMSAMEWNQDMDTPGITIHFTAGGYPVNLHLRIDGEESQSGGKL